jgi:hypothetical protein
MSGKARGKDKERGKGPRNAIFAFGQRHPALRLFALILDRVHPLGEIFPQGPLRGKLIGCLQNDCSDVGVMKRMNWRVLRAAGRRQG